MAEPLARQRTKAKRTRELFRFAFQLSPISNDEKDEDTLDLSHYIHKGIETKRNSILSPVTRVAVLASVPVPLIS